MGIQVMRVTAIFLLLALFNIQLFAGGPANQYIDVSYAYSQGDFDTDQKTRLTQLQLTYGQVQGRFDFSADLPFLFLQDSFGDETGLGDITLRGGMAVIGNNLAPDNLYASVAVKLPTADEAKGLGTGEPDVGGFLSYTRDFNFLNLTVLGGYIVTGDSRTQSYNNIAVYEVALSKMMAPWFVYGSLTGRQQTLDYGDDPLELNGGFFYHIKSGLFFKVDTFVGLSDGSPDMGVMFGIVQWL